MKILFFILIALALFSCKKYDCGCKTELMNKFPPSNYPSYSNKQISAISKSRATKKCEKGNSGGSYGSELTTCTIK